VAAAGSGPDHSRQGGLILSETSIENLLTFILGCMTAWMAFATQKMASATREMAKLDGEPYLSFSSVDIRTVGRRTAPDQPLKIVGLQPFVCLKNPGRVRISYEIEKIDFTLKGKHYPLEKGNDLSNVLHPGEVISNFYSMIPSDIALGPGDGGLCSLVVAFWRIPVERHVLSLSIRFTFEKTGDDLKIGWRYIEGPTYT
jgi:hypothetical protein